MGRSSSFYRNAGSHMKATLAANEEARESLRRSLKARGEAVKAAEAERPRLTREQIAGATHVRTRFGWHKVARVNKTTVSVETGYSWTDRYPFDEIHEARTL